MQNHENKTSNSIPFPDEIIHLEAINQKLDMALSDAEATVNRLDHEYTEAKRYMSEYRSEIDPHEMFQNELGLRQIDGLGVFAVEVRDKVAKSDYLSYFGSILGFLGSTALAALALWQNQRLHQINTKILENEQRFTGIPQFEISDVTVSYINAFLDKDTPEFVEKNGYWEAELVTHDPADQDCEMSLVT